MKHSYEPKVYSSLEERINVVSHVIGFVLSFVALFLLVEKAGGSLWRLISFSIFGVSLVVLYGASFVYHASTGEVRKRRRIWDHAAIYVLIAGTYTPYKLVVMHGQTGWILFAVNWLMALGGIILKLFFTGKYTVLSTIFYLVMGWSIVFAIKPLTASLPEYGVYWLLSGGIAYTIGALLYCIKGLRFSHAMFHVLVLLGSFCHFISIYFYV